MTTSKKMGLRGLLGCLALAAGLAFAPSITTAQDAATTAQETGDGKPWQDYYAAFAGKKVAFVPMSLSFDIAQAYDGSMRAMADAYGYTYEVRDANWSVENAVQIAEQYIAEEPLPDVMVVHPLDDKAFLRVVRRARDAGIFVVFMNLRLGAGTDSMDSDAFIGPDHYDIGKQKVELAAELCANSESKKIAIMQAPLTNSVAIAETKGEEFALQSHPELELVAMQSADSDANKAKAIAATILKQHPDLCAFIGQWEGQDLGIPPAIEEAGLTGKVQVITSGGGSQTTACDTVANGTFAAYISHNIGEQTVALGSLIKQVFQAKPDTSATSISIYVDTPVITAASLVDTPCWNLASVTRALN